MDRDNLWEKIKKNVKDGATLSFEKIEEFSKIGKLKIEEFAAKKKVERNCIDIGERVFDLVETGKSATLAEDLLVKKACENIRRLNQEIADIDTKIKTISEEAKKSRNPSQDDSDPIGI